jgi:hypothetical protein
VVNDDSSIFPANFYNTFLQKALHVPHSPPKRIKLDSSQTLHDLQKTWKPMNSARPGRTSGCEPPTPKLQADSALGLWHLLRKAHLSQVLCRGIRHTLLQGFHLDLEQGHRGVSPSKTGGRMGMSWDKGRDLEKYGKIIGTDGSSPMNHGEKGGFNQLQ